MLLPKRTKHRKVHRGRMTGKATRGNKVSYGDFGLQATEPTWLTSNQIEAARIAMTRFCKRAGRVWIKVFPDKPVSKKPLETRMGKGKGGPEFWVAVVKPGRVMFEMADISEEVAKEAMRLAAMKLPIGCKFVKREGEAKGTAAKRIKKAVLNLPEPEVTEESADTAEKSENPDKSGGEES